MPCTNRPTALRRHAVHGPSGGELPCATRRRRAVRFYLDSHSYTRALVASLCAPQLCARPCARRSCARHSVPALPLCATDISLSTEVFLNAWQRITSKLLEDLTYYHSTGRTFMSMAQTDRHTSQLHLCCVRKMVEKQVRFRKMILDANSQFCHDCHRVPHNTRCRFLLDPL